MRTLRTWRVRVHPGVQRPGAPGCGCAGTVPGTARDMAADIAQRFIDALHTLETGGSADELVALYTDDAVCGNTTTARTFDGPDGAREFWLAYREVFGDIHSEFRAVVRGDAAAALEWTSTGTLSGGTPIAYEGVTLLHVDGDRIARSTAYFDPRAMLGSTGAA